MIIVCHLNEPRSQRLLWLLGDALSGADVQMSFVGEAARGLRASYPRIDAWVRRFQQRPAYRRALERGRPYSMAD